MTVTGDQAWDVARNAVFAVLAVPLEQLSRNTRLVDELGADSLALVEIVEVSEEQLRARGISVWVEDETLAALTVLGDLVRALQTAKEK